ncbi:MAG: glucose 1-dehydrogenase [Proteobacteria bacterium]|nr:glucose 1-dehydrogenase [Pseudomonadota bacterium]MBU1060501.1 glucose 1-dehydrogenase [Pseudomonadota bacterium]
MKTKRGHTESQKGRTEFDLDGKVALVTGAGRGIGREIALALARYGADLVLWSRTQSELERVAEEVRRLGSRVLIQPGDITEVAALGGRVQVAVDEFGTIDILVNNAGVNIPMWAEDVDEASWDKVMDINLKGVFFCAQAVGQVMIRQKKGKIINVSSQAGKVGMIKRAAYCASKGAVDQLTRVMALEWAKYNINVNAIAPTFIETAMTQDMFKDKAFSDWVYGNLMLDRLAKAEDIIGGVLYLASNAADMVTGHILYIDGGWTAH